MSRRATLILVLLLIAVVPSSTASRGGTPIVWPQRDEVVVMTLNMRTSIANDGWNAWPFRRGRVAHVLREEAPDLVAVQEANPWQIDDIKRSSPGYTIVTGRSGDQWRGYPVIFYRTDRFIAKKAIRVWLSEAPKIPESISWGNNRARCFTVVELYDRFEAQSLRFVSVHLDHQSANSRAISTAAMADWVRQHRDLPLVVAGDFNEPADSVALNSLMSDNGYEYDAFGRLHDSYLLAHQPEQGTLHGYTGKANQRIDLILVSDEWDVVKSYVVKYHEGGIYPSDHYPVVAFINLPAKPNLIAVLPPATF